MKTKKQKRTEAETRDAAWKKLNPKRQLVELDKRLGKDVGAKKQRARLQKQIEEGNQ